MMSAIFWICLSLSVLSFLLFANLAYAAAHPAPVAKSGGAEMDPRGGVPTAKEAGDMATAFGKAGPIATAATLSIFFMSVALVVSGVLKVAVGAAP